MKRFDCIVIGAGPAGCMAAITAAKLGSSVLLLERNPMIGKKLLTTGNGRCNFTNDYMDASCFYGLSEEDFKSIMSSFSNLDLVDFMSSLGILPTRLHKTYVYPNSLQATSIVTALSGKLSELGVTTITSSFVQRIQASRNCFSVYVENREDPYIGDRVILTAGGNAVPKSGSDGNGMKLAKKMGHTNKNIVPGLVPLLSEDNEFKKLHGIRLNGQVTAFVGEEMVGKSLGEIQFLKDGISGIPVFQISRFLTRGLEEGKKATLKLHLLPDMSEHEIVSWLKSIRNNQPSLSFTDAFTGTIPKAFTECILNRCKIEQDILSSDLTDDDISSITAMLSSFTVSVTGSKGFPAAQVTSGGVPLDEIHLSSMESKICPGLFLAGEVVDVDAICGGYNLQWAFSTGFIAGTYASKN